MGKTNPGCAAVFLDRDGTLIREKNYLRRIGDVQLITGAVSALQKLKEKGYKLVLVTNQSGIARGYFTEEKLLRIHDHLQKVLEKQGVRLDAIYYCPHLPDDRCSCRKPRLGLIRRAAKEHGIDVRKSYSVGDHVGDFLLGQNMGGKGVFVLTGHGVREKEKISASDGELAPDYIAKNLPSAARWILKETAGARRSEKHRGPPLKKGK